MKLKFYLFLSLLAFLNPLSAQQFESARQFASSEAALSHPAIVVNAVLENNEVAKLAKVLQTNSKLTDAQMLKVAENFSVSIQDSSDQIPTKLQGTNLVTFLKMLSSPVSIPYKDKNGSAHSADLETTASLLNSVSSPGLGIGLCIHQSSADACLVRPSRPIRNALKEFSLPKLIIKTPSGATFERNFQDTLGGAMIFIEKERPFPVDAPSHGYCLIGQICDDTSTRATTSLCPTQDAWDENLKLIKAVLESRQTNAAVPAAKATKSSASR